MKVVDIIARILVLIGAINWGCIGFFNFNLVNFFFGNMIIEKVIYDAVGISALYLLLRCRKCCSSKRT